VLGERIELLTPNGALELFAGDESGLGWWSPVYGRVEPSSTVRLSHAGGTPFWTVSVFGLNAANPIEDVETVPVWAEAGILSHSVALRISRAAGTDHILLAEPAAATLPLARSWRVAEFETDAAMLFCRTDGEGHLTRAAIVDGSRMRFAGGSRVAVTLPAPAADLHLDLFGEEARLSGPSQGVRVQVGSQLVSVAVERRSRARRRAAGRSR
jgi:hypothetical protein